MDELQHNDSAIQSYLCHKYVRPLFLHPRNPRKSLCCSTILNINILTLEPNTSPSQSDPSCRRSPTPIVRSHRGNPNHGWSATPFRMVSFSLSSSSSLVLVTAPVHVWRRQSASPLQGKLLLRKSQFFPSLRGRSPAIQLQRSITWYGMHVYKTHTMQILSGKY